MELNIKKCSKCGALVEVLQDCNCQDCGINCCNEKMVEIKPNNIDLSTEKYIFNYEIVDNEIIVSVNYDMTEEYYIKWIAIVTDDKICKKLINQNNKTIVKFPYEKGSKLYAFCNKDELWTCIVE